MVFVELRLAQNLIRHGTKIICKSLDNFGIFMILEAPQVSHVNEDKVVELDPEMAALLYVYREAWLLFRELRDEPILVSQRFADLHSYLSSGLLFGIELSIVQHKLLVLEEHRDPQILYWLFVVS